MGDKIIGCFYYYFFRRPFFQHRHQFRYKKAKTDGCRLRIDNRQIKIRILLQYICFCNIGSIKSPGYTGRKANINNAVPSLRIRQKRLLKHSRIDVVSPHIPLCIIQNIIKFFRLDSFTIKIIRFINHNGSRYHMKIMSFNILLRQIRGGICNYSKHMNPPSRSNTFIYLSYLLYLPHTVQQFNLYIIQFLG